MTNALRACVACLLVAVAAGPARAAPPANAATFAIACSRIGEQAQRIALKREAGATLEQQLADRATMLLPADQARTVQAVYARRGSVADIRSQIESDCMAVKAREAEAAGNRPSASSCRSLKQSVEDIRARLAQGGSGRQMELLQNERRSAEQSYRDSGCS